ncbi:MAG: hypothetical protein FRX49_10233 [Trebouxia sp. A1-2]|nr:MAG: hypothetical protein FRX49_10233 [Trebouxia sp. A1-2]
MNLPEHWHAGAWGGDGAKGLDEAGERVVGTRVVEHVPGELAACLQLCDLELSSLLGFNASRPGLMQLLPKRAHSLQQITVYGRTLCNLTRLCYIEYQAKLALGIHSFRQEQ